MSFTKAAIFSIFVPPILKSAKKRKAAEEAEKDEATGDSAASGSSDGKDDPQQLPGDKPEPNADGVIVHPDHAVEEPFRVKHRYLPIISGLACPFSVLLDVCTSSPHLS
jgi:hypothetical protein